MSFETLYAYLLRNAKHIKVSGIPGGGAEDLMDIEPEEGETLQDVIDAVAAANERIILQSEMVAAENAALIGDQPGVSMRGGMTRALEVPWTSIIYGWATQQAEKGWVRPFNPAIYSSTGLASPGRADHHQRLGELVVVLDSSGSINSETLAKFFGVVQHILDDSNFEKVHLLSVDVAVREAITLEEGDSVPDKMMGGGGTRFTPAFEWVEQNLDDAPEGLVYLTDGHGSLNFDAPDYPVLWASHNGIPLSSYPWGEVVEAL